MPAEQVPGGHGRGQVGRAAAQVGQRGQRLADGTGRLQWQQVGGQGEHAPAPGGSARDHEVAAEADEVTERLDLGLAQGGGVEVVDDDRLEAGQEGGVGGKGLRRREAGGRDLGLEDVDVAQRRVRALLVAQDPERDARAAK